MNALADVSPALERLFDRLDAEPRDETLREDFAYWSGRRGPRVCPSFAALRIAEMRKGRSGAFAFQGVKPKGPDWRLCYAGEEVSAWLEPGSEALLSRFGARRAVVRLRRLFAMAVKKGEPVVATFKDPFAGDKEPIEVMVLPLAADGVHPDGVFGAIHRAVAESREAGSPVSQDTGEPSRDDGEQADAADAAAAPAGRPAAAPGWPAPPIASDIMSTDVVTVGPDTPVAEIARTLLVRRIGAVPVVDDGGRMIGIVSEADLVARAGEDPMARPSWWVMMMKSDAELASHYVRMHGMTAKDVMTRDVVTVDRDASVRQLTARMAGEHVRRVVVADGDVPVGIVTRTDLLRAQAALPESGGPTGDTALRDRLLQQLRSQPWYHLSNRDVVVIDGVACFWGTVKSEAERQALRIAALEVPGIRGVDMHVELGGYWPAA